MAKVVDIRPHTAWVQAKRQLDRKPPDPGKRHIGSCLSCSKMEGNKYAEVDNVNDSIQKLSIHGE